MFKLIVVVMLFVAVCYARNAMPDKTDNQFQQECLQISNAYRARHHSPGLTSDQSLIDYAKSRCYLISQYESLSHGHAGLAKGTGENLAWSGNSANVVGSGRQAIDMWYNEVKDYNYDTTGFSGRTGHFTQLVWKGTSRVGCARCYGRGSQWYETYTVCNYRPAGNMMGDNNRYFRENVLRP
ncbi:Golgi-associated plant pathogenesis-related protein 1-like [Oppia nitens]|uniref:Golgi-associated plant pathogenesis-related protein 1-like n=1 Tax=Oppia nitens TaxID=1686743 RepID=UPI0023DC95F2|nr:Golgi-associated plant pathogenesis-related protein 1-like [Oppia nitens]